MQEVEKSIFTKTFLWMFLGLLGTAIIAWFCYSTDLCMQLATSGSYVVILIIELIAVLLFNLFFKKLPATIVGILYFVYSFMNGISLSTIFYLYEITSIGFIFLMTSLVFGVLAYLGYKVDIDITKWSTILYTILVIGIITSIVNLFIGNQMIDIIITWAMLGLFFFITVMDMNKIKVLSQDPSFPQDKVHIYGAMELYLDFINIFLRLLRAFGKRRN